MEIRKTFVRTVAPFSRGLSVQALLRRARVSLLLPFYHIVSDDACIHVKHLYRFKNVNEFRRDLDALLRDFTPISAHEISRLDVTDWTGKPPMHLTFDDGLKEMRTIVAPLLLEKGIPATFFINTDFVGNHDLMFRYKASLMAEKFPDKKQAFLDAADSASIKRMPEYEAIDFIDFLKTRQPYMTWNEVIELQGLGFTIGSHSASHPYFNRISESEQLVQALSPFAVMEKNGVHVRERLFAFPFTDSGVTEATIKNILDGGEVAYCFGGAGCKRESEPRHLQRIPMEGYNSPAGDILRAELLYTVLRGGMQKHVVKRS